MAEQIHDIVKMRKRRIRRRRLQKLLLIGLILAALVLLYQKRESWIPKLEGIGSPAGSISENEDGSSGFPLKIADDARYQSGEMDRYYVLLTDAYFYMYTQNGTLTETRQHTYANALLQTAGKRALIYESSGNSFRLENKHKTVYEKTVDSQILFARLAENGCVALVTTSETCACVLRIYDSGGAQLYERQCVDLLMDVGFYDDGESCIIASYMAQNGKSCTVLTSLRFDSPEAEWSSEPLNTLCIAITPTKDGGVLLIGDTLCAAFGSSGSLLYSVSYDGVLTDSDTQNGKAAVLLENEGQRQHTMLLMTGSEAQPVQVEFDNIVTDICLDGGDPLVLTKHTVEAYDFQGVRIKEQSFDGTYQSMMRIEKHLFLQGYDTIERITFDT